MRSRLFVYVPGIGSTTSRWEPLIERLKKEPGLEDADWLPWDHNQKWYGSGRIGDLAAGLVGRINERWVARGPFDHVTLMGHSLGGIIIRKAYMIGSGQDEIYTQDKTAWSARVDRIILMAALNRGFDPTYTQWGFVIKAVLAYPGFKLSRDYLVGSDVITDLRIAWIRYFRELSDEQPTVIQIQGRNDRWLKRDESTDVEQFPRAKVERVDATHTDLILLSEDAPDERYAVLKQHILHTQGIDSSPNTESRVKHVIFLVHGIRASTSDWPTRAKRIIENDYPDVIRAYCDSVGWSLHCD